VDTGDQRRRDPATEDDLTEDMIVSSRRRTRMNAVVLLLVFGLLTFAPQPWALFAPLLLLIPLLQGVMDRMRRGFPADGRMHPPEAASHPEPYSLEPRDPEDPRRYRPIG
jgi:hypothetical protein